MDATAHYRQLAQLGRAAFLAAAAPAALVRPRGSGSSDFDGLAATGTYDQPTERRKGGAGDHADAGLAAGPDADVEVLPLIKKPGAPFGDRVTVGRTSNNDVVIAHHTVSRLHLYFRHRDGRWWVTDAGSKNGTALGRGDLVARRETSLADGDPLWIGDIAVVFHTAASLYTVLGGR
jgi:hypothetical protein